jgi:hypothetical protein
MYGVHRTTVYLPDDLRDQLALAAKEDRRSEAELIREGVERVLRERALRSETPAPQVPLMDTGRPALGLALDWFFAAAPSETLEWLVRDAMSVWAERLDGAPSHFTFRIQFRGLGEDGNEWTQTIGGPSRKNAATWANICWSLARWQATVMDSRPRPDGWEVLVVRQWETDHPPESGVPPVELARVEIGPRVSAASRRR